MFQILNDYRLFLGGLLGFALFSAVWFVANLITAASAHSDKWKAKYRDSLLRKLQGAGYSVYSPLVMSSQINLRDPLTHEEQVVLNLDRMIVFDDQGNTITGLVPLTAQSEELAGHRRGLFRVIPGGKQD
jgi:hypothetical protein